jgi:predicted O-methyltransferase YrrM
MNNTDFENTAKAWQFIEKESISGENDLLKDTRRRGADAGFRQGSAAQARFLSVMAQSVKAESAILLGTGSLVETERLIESLGGEGILTVVDSTAKGADIIRATFGRVQDRVKTKLRVVNVAVDEYLSKLNADDYDVMVITGDASNYQPAYDSAARLLRKGGVLIVTDALALHHNPDGGLTNPADRSEKAVALRGVLDSLKDDEQFELSLIPVGTGIALALRK